MNFNSNEEYEMPLNMELAQQYKDDLDENEEFERMIGIDPATDFISVTELQNSEIAQDVRGTSEDLGLGERELQVLGFTDAATAEAYFGGDQVSLDQYDRAWGDLIANGGTLSDTLPE